jgi:hypothetical protein
MRENGLKKFFENNMSEQMQSQWNELSGLKYFYGPGKLNKLDVSRRYESDFTLLRKMVCLQLKDQSFFTNDRYETFMCLLKHLVDAYIQIKQKKQAESGEICTAEDIDEAMIGIRPHTVKHHQPFLSKYPNLFFDEFQYNLNNANEMYFYTSDSIDKLRSLNNALQTYERLFYSVLNYIEEKEFDEMNNARADTVASSYFTQS